MANEKRTEIFISKGYASEEPNLFVGVNGVNYLLPRGQKSLVPAFVAAEVERSCRAQTLLDEKMDALLGEKT